MLKNLDLDLLKENIAMVGRLQNSPLLSHLFGWPFFFLPGIQFQRGNRSGIPFVFPSKLGVINKHRKFCRSFFESLHKTTCLAMPSRKLFLRRGVRSTANLIYYKKHGTWKKWCIFLGCMFDSYQTNLSTNLSIPYAPMYGRMFTYILTYKFKVNVGRYSSPMEHQIF